MLLTSKGVSNIAVMDASKAHSNRIFLPRDTKAFREDTKAFREDTKAFREDTKAFREDTKARKNTATGPARKKSASKGPATSSVTELARKELGKCLGRRRRSHRGCK